MEKLNVTFFYHLETAIKSYRQHAQAQLNENGLDITVDQWLVLKTISDYPEVTQKELAENVFKDQASITRIVDLLVKRGFISRKPNSDNRRSNQITLTKKGEAIIEKLIPVVKNYRKKALKKIASGDLKITENVLKQITENCKK